MQKENVGMVVGAYLERLLIEISVNTTTVPWTMRCCSDYAWGGAVSLGLGLGLGLGLVT